MKAPDEKPATPREMIGEFYHSICEVLSKSYEAEFGTLPTEAWLQEKVLSEFYILFRRWRRFRDDAPWKVEELFAEFSPMEAREESRARERTLARIYGNQWKPPKQRFARWAAEENAERLDRGYPKSELLGSGTTEFENMHQYVKVMLRKKECREIADAECERV
jgi:hypothetical protein